MARYGSGDGMLRRLRLFVGLALVLATTGAFAKSPPAISWPAPRHMTSVRSADGVVLQTYEWGNPQGRPIVFIHGIDQSALSWSKQVSDPALTTKYRLIAFDLRGHGASDKPDGAAYYREGRRWADDLAAVLDALNVRKPVIVAWSYGGRVLNDYLAAQGDARLAGIVYVAARATKDDRPEPPSVRRSNASRDATSADPTIFIRGTREFVELCFGTEPSPAVIDELTAASMQTPLYVRRELVGRPLAYDQVLRAITVPTLIIQGDRDAVVPPRTAELTQRLVPHSTLIIYKDVGHSSFFEAPERFDADLRRFVDLLP